MALPEIKVRISSDTAQAERGIRDVNEEMGRLKVRADAAEQSVTRFSGRLAAATNTSARFTNTIRNTSFQVNDFAVQVAAGTAVSVAMAQQLPQLLQGFGTFGAVLSVVVAIAIPLRTAMKGLAADGRDVTEVFGTLQPVFRSIGDAMSGMGAALRSVAETIVNNMDRILIVAATAAAFFAVRWVAGMVAARVATMSFAASLAFLRGALIRTGIGAAIVGTGELIYQFTRLSQAAGGFGEAVALVKDVILEAFGRIGFGITFLGQSFAAMANGMYATFVGALTRMSGSFIGFLQDVTNGINSVFGTSIPLPSQDATWALWNEALDAQEAASSASAGAGAARSQLEAPLESIQRIRDLLAGMKEENITLDSILGIGDGKGKDGGKSLDEKLTEQEERIKEHMDRIRALTQGGLSDKLGAWGDYFSNLASLTGSNNRKLLAVSKSFAQAQALIDAYTAYNKVLADPTLPWWARIPAAANVFAAGIGAVNAIRSIGSGGGGGAAPPSGGTGGVSVSAPPQTPLSVRLQGISPGDLITGAQLGSLLDRLNDEAGDRGFRLLVAQ